MDEQLYLMAVGLSLDEKVEKAIETLRFYERIALGFDPINGYRNGDSYGKDSCVDRALLQMAGCKFIGVHNFTTMDSGELLRWGRKNHPETKELRPKEHMLRRLPKYARGMPTRGLAWCCETYKHASFMNDDGVYVLGIRYAEGASRRGRWRVMTPIKGSRRVCICPILYWTDEDLWRFIERFNVPYSPLYDEDGIDRMGCVGCPKSSKRKQEFRRWPRYEAAWKKACKEWFENWHERPLETGEPRWTKRAGFTKWENLWDWWMEENQPEAEDDCQMGLF